MLRELGELIGSIGSYEHYCFRIAETEFAVVFCGGQGGVTKEGEMRLAEYIKSKIESAICPKGIAAGFRFAVKVGVAAYPADGTSESSLMHSARSSLL